MIFEFTTLAGLVIIHPERLQDHRGFFARTFCEREFLNHGLATRFPQCNISFNAKRGTLRGIHYQREPEPEIKIVRCTRGGIYDVAVDLRRHSDSYLKTFSIELTKDNCLSLYIPAGFAHGFQTLVDNSEVFYQMGEFYNPNLAAGVRWSDPTFDISWPIPEPVISDRDRSFPDFESQKEWLFS